MQRDVDYAVELEERDVERMEQIDTLQNENERLQQETSERIDKLTVVGDINASMCSSNPPGPNACSS